MFLFKFVVIRIHLEYVCIILQFPLLRIVKYNNNNNNNNNITIIIIRVN